MWEALALALTLLGTSAGLVWLLRRQELTEAAMWVQTLSLPLATITVVISLISWWRPPAEVNGATSTLAPVDLATRRLADLVLQQWEEEIKVRQLDDAVPQGVRWRLTDLDVIDHPKNVFRASSLSVFLRGWSRPRFSGSTDRVDQMVAQFRRLERRRLVIIGAPGMGKTTLAVLMLRELLRHPKPNEPVPVLFTLSAWDPDSESFHTWLTRRLEESHPALQAAGLGPDVLRALVAGQRVVPVLDGLDELREPVRIRMISALNSAMTITDQLILTCRTDEYIAAVNAQGGDVLTGGAVIEPTPLDGKAAVAYLGRSGTRGRAGWPRFFAEITANPNGTVARALTTPLMLWLIRKVYVDGNREPSQLYDESRFPTAESLEAHLLDRLVDTVITANPPREGADSDHPFSPLRMWDPVKAERWLGFLANHLANLKVYDLAWWQLYRSGPDWIKGMHIPLWEEPAHERAQGLKDAILGGPPGAQFPRMLAVAPDESSTVQTPATTLKRDLVRTVTLGPAYGLAMGLLMASGFAILPALAGEVSTWSFYVPPVVLFLLGGILMVARFRPSSTYLVTVLVLAARGLVPLRLMAFLGDMHRLGLLRQVGPVYQFRHAKLQDRLAETHRAARMG